MKHAKLVWWCWFLAGAVCQSSGAINIAKDGVGQATILVADGSSEADGCEGLLPAPDGRVAMRRRKEARQLRYQLGAPAGCAARATALDGLEIARDP